MRRYAPVYNPAANARGVDTSSTYNPAPQGVRVKGKARIRKSGKATMRQQAMRIISREVIPGL